MERADPELCQCRNPVGGRAGCALHRERRQRGASSGRRAAQAAAPAPPALRAAGAATAAVPPLATAPPIPSPWPGTECPAISAEVSSVLLPAAARGSLPVYRARAGTRDSDGRGGACAGATVAWSGPQVPQPGPPASAASRGSGCGPRSAPTGLGGRRPSLSLARASEPAGGQAGGRRRRV